MTRTANTDAAKAWLRTRLAYIRGLKKPSEAQELLVLLAEKSDRSPEEDRQLAVLAKAEWAAERALAARAKASQITGRRKAEERKARNHRLILQGLLLDLVGLDRWDRAELAGALLSLAEGPLPTSAQRDAWRRSGATILANSPVGEPLRTEAP